MYEKEYKDILIKNPNLIEDGLTFIGREVNVMGRKIDILFEDRYKIKLIIEAKINKIKDKDVGQVMDYYTNLLNEGPRLMFICPDIPLIKRNTLDKIGIEWKEIRIEYLTDFIKSYDELVKKSVLNSLNKIFQKPDKIFYELIRNQISTNELYNFSNEDILYAIGFIRLSYKTDSNYENLEKISNDDIKSDSLYENIHDILNPDTIRKSFIDEFLNGDIYPKYLSLYNGFIDFLKKQSIEFDIDTTNDYIKLENYKGCFLLIYPQKRTLKLYYPFDNNYLQDKNLPSLPEGKDKSTGKFKVYYKLKNKDKFDLMLDYIKIALNK